jgi:hypothetical protein
VAESATPGGGHAERTVLSHPRQEEGDEQADAERAGDYVGRRAADQQLTPAQEQSAKAGDGAARSPEIEPVDPERMKVVTRKGGRPPRVVRDPNLGEHAVRVNLHGHGRGEIAKAHTEPTQGKARGEPRAHEGCKTGEDRGDGEKHGNVSDYADPPV